MKVASLPTLPLSQMHSHLRASPDGRQAFLGPGLGFGARDECPRQPDSLRAATRRPHLPSPQLRGSYFFDHLQPAASDVGLLGPCELPRWRLKVGLRPPLVKVPGKAPWNSCEAICPATSGGRGRVRLPSGRGAPFGPIGTHGPAWLSAVWFGP